MRASLYKPENARPLLNLYKRENEGCGRDGLYKLVEEYGLPTKKLERWKYSDLSKALSRIEISRTGSLEISSGIKMIECDQISSPYTHGYTKQNDTMLRTLSELLSPYGHEIVIDKALSSSPKEPITLSQKSVISNSINTGNIVVRINKGVECYIQEALEIVENSWFCGQITYILEQGANVIIARNMGFAEGSAHTNTIKVIQHRDTNFKAYTYINQGNFVREEYEIDLIEENANCEIHVASNLTKYQHADNTILINHIAPHCTSRQFVRNVLNDNSRGVFQGKTHVFKDAQKTDGYQMSNALLLSSTAEMNAKPELEIYADDVQCSHGSTMGQLDEEALFYMESRGISADEAKSLLIKSFISQVFDGCPDEIKPYTGVL